jgi:hypothetical protein
MQIMTAMAGGGTFFERFTNLLISFDIDSDSRGFGSEACKKRFISLLTCFALGV